MGTLTELTNRVWEVLINSTKLLMHLSEDITVIIIPRVPLTAALRLFKFIHKTQTSRVNARLASRHTSRRPTST